MPILNVHDNSTVPSLLSFAHLHTSLCAGTIGMYWGWSRVKGRKLQKWEECFRQRVAMNGEVKQPAIYGDYLGFSAAQEEEGRQNVDGFLWPAREFGFCPFATSRGENLYTLKG